MAISTKIGAKVLLANCLVMPFAGTAAVAADTGAAQLSRPSLVLSTRVTGDEITKDFADFVGEFGQVSAALAIAGQSLSAIISRHCGETHELYDRAVYRANNWPVKPNSRQDDISFEEEKIVHLPPCIPIPLYRVETVSLGKNDSVDKFFQRDNAGFKILWGNRSSDPVLPWSTGQRFSQADLKRNDRGPLFAWRHDNYPKTWGSMPHATSMSTDNSPIYNIELTHSSSLAYSNALQILNPELKQLIADKSSFSSGSTTSFEFTALKDLNVPRSEKRWVSIPLKDSAVENFGDPQKVALAMAATLNYQETVDYDPEGYVHFAEVDSDGCSSKNSLNDPEQMARNAELVLRVLITNRRLGSGLQSSPPMRLTSEIVLPDAGVFSSDNSPFRMPAQPAPLYGLALQPDPLRQYYSPYPDHKTKREHGTKTAFVAIGGPILYSSVSEAGFDLTLKSVNIYKQSYQYAYNNGV